MKNLKKKEIERVVNGYIWLATLDNKTCLRCAALDGTFYLLESKRPKMPLYDGCRCCYVPVTKTWKELGIEKEENSKILLRPDNFKVGVPCKTCKTFSQKFRTEFTREQKINLVGSKRFKYVEFDLELSDLVDYQTGKLHSLKKLKEMVGI